MSSGCKKPLLYLVESKLGSTFEASNLVSCLGALKALYVPLEMREGVPEKAIKLDTVGVYVGEDKNLPNVLKLATIIEDGKSVCRDIGGSDPERTAAPRGNFKNFFFIILQRNSSHSYIIRVSNIF